MKVLLLGCSSAMLLAAPCWCHFNDAMYPSLLDVHGMAIKVQCGAEMQEQNVPFYPLGIAPVRL